MIRRERAYPRGEFAAYSLAIRHEKAYPSREFTAYSLAARVRKHTPEGNLQDTAWRPGRLDPRLRGGPACRTRGTSPFRGWHASHCALSPTGPLVPRFMPTFTADASPLLTAPATPLMEGTAGSATTTPIPGFDPDIPVLSLIPPKLAQKILKAEYIEMRELLPESWHTEEAKDSCCRTPRPRRGGLVTDITLWTECYASMVAVLTTKFPEKAPHFMDYMRTIVRASRTFEGSAWASYDAAFRRRAANQHSLDWAKGNSALFNEVFAGRGKVLARCIHCLAETHESRDCFYAPQVEPPHKMPRPATGWGPAAGSSRPPRPLGVRGPGPGGVETCDLFNRPSGNQCTFRWCRYAHICARCMKAPHPAAECPRLGAGRGGFGRRSPPPRRVGGAAPAAP